MPRKPKKKLASKPVVEVPKPKSKKLRRLSRADRTKILAEAEANHWTAAQIARRAGVSRWTVYGWRKAASRARRGVVLKSRVARRAPRSAVKATALGTGKLAEMLRPLIAQLVRDELSRLLGAAT